MCMFLQKLTISLGCMVVVVGSCLGIKKIFSFCFLFGAISLNDHWNAVVTAELGNLAHCFKANFSSSYKGVSVFARTAGFKRIIEMHQLEQSWTRKSRLDIRDGIIPFTPRIFGVSAGKHVAGVQTHAEALIFKALHKIQEFCHISEGFCSLTCRSLKEEWTLFGC